MGTGTQGWVVCRHATRQITEDRVLCPLRGPVALRTCLGCHQLVTSSDERAGTSWCRAAGRSVPARRALRHSAAVEVAP